MYASEQVYLLKKTFKALDDLDKDVEAHEKAAIELGARREKIRDDCPHMWEYIPDASGNNDSYDRCAICGRTK